MKSSEWNLAIDMEINAALKVDDDRGYYVMGQHTSCAWCLTRKEAEELARQLNFMGGSDYTVQAVK